MTTQPITREVVVRSVLRTVFPLKELDQFLPRQVRDDMRSILEQIALKEPGQFDENLVAELANFLAPHAAQVHKTEVTPRYLKAMTKVVRQGAWMLFMARRPYEMRQAYEVVEEDLYDFLTEPFDVFSEEDKELFLLAAAYGHKSSQTSEDPDVTPFELEQVSLNRHQMVKFVRELKKRLSPASPDSQISPD